MTVYSWKSAGLQEFIDSIHSSVSQVEKQLEHLRKNVKAIRGVVDDWSAAPLLERKDAKQMLNLEGEKSKVWLLFAYRSLWAYLWL